MAAYQSVDITQSVTSSNSSESDASLVAHGVRQQMLSAEQIKADYTLAAALKDFINKGFATNARKDPTIIWEQELRFKDANEIHEMLGSTGVFSVVYDNDTLVACAAAIPWKGGSMGSYDPEDSGWEIKTVVVNEGYLNQGLASRCLAGLESYLVQHQRARAGGERKVLKLWVQAADYLNGAYWRRRGYREVALVDQPVGVWGSITGFTLLIAVKEIAIHRRANSTT